MDPALAWLLLGLGLIVVELLTGTFYLLIFGIAAILGSAAAWFGGPFAVQAVLAAVAAVAGILILRKRRAGATTVQDKQIDVGQTAVLESWISEPQRMARVRYRDATWEAEVAGTDAVAPGSLLFILAVDGNRLKTSSSRPT